MIGAKFEVKTPGAVVVLKRCSLLLTGLLLALVVPSGLFHSAMVQTTPLPAEITDAEFWRIITEFSESGGILQK